MPEQKIITREFDEPVDSSKACEKVLEIAELSENLLKLSPWKGKVFSSVQVTFTTPFHAPEKLKENVQSLREIRNHVIEFGSHAGSRLDDIPLSYLEYIYEAQRDLQEKLKFYLNHPTIKHERQDE